MITIVVLASIGGFALGVASAFIGANWWIRRHFSRMHW